MKKRYCCQMAAAVVVILFLAYHVIGAQSFSALQVSELEALVTEGEELTVYGSIQKKLRKENGFDFYVKPVNQKEFVYVVLSEDGISENLKIGQTVSVTGTVVLFHESPNPGNFNQKFYYQKQNIYVKLQEASVVVHDSTESVCSAMKEELWKIQQTLSDNIVFYAGERYGGILSAMVVGEDIWVDAELKELLQKSGIGHLLAISGLHVSFIGAGLYKIMRKIRIPISISAVSSGVALTFYILMIGGGTSAIRAWIMCLLQMGANITGREYDGKTTLAVAALVVLGGEPVLLFDAGFLLSFGAVFGIYVIAPALKIKVPLAIQSILLPIQLYYYYEICIYSLVWNLFAIPLSTITLGSGIIGAILSLIPFVPEILINIVLGVGKLVIWIYETGSTFVLDLPFSRWVIGQPSFLWMGIYYMVLVVCMILQVRKKQMESEQRIRLELLGKWIPAIAIFMLVIGTQCPSGELEITMLNVGQGDCLLIQSPEGGNYLVDGGSSSVSKVGQYRMEPYLKQQGIGRLDYVWVTHGDSDHVNGILEMLERKRVGVEIRHLILPPKIYWNENILELVAVAQTTGTQIHIMNQGQRLEEGEMQVRCLWPSAEEEGLDENQASIVLSLTYGSFDMLFTGDLEKEAEETVALYIEEGQRENILSDKYEVLKVGHHGSKNSTSEGLLERIRPVIGLISAGENNRYGHPHAETIERMEKIGCDMYMTQERGMIKISTDGKNVLLD